MNLETRRLFVMNDRRPNLSGAVEVDLEGARRWNTMGCGVYMVANDFEGDRKAENLTHVNAWFMEIDDLPKPQQLAVIEIGLYPSLIIETKNSFHTYFYARLSEIESFVEIQERLIEFYGSDDKIKDPLRLMRAPGFFHLKDPVDPFECRVIWQGAFAGRPIAYAPKVMRHYYPEKPPKKTLAQPGPGRSSINDQTFDLFGTIYELDHMQVLKDFSGTSYVNYETYTFQDNRNGKYNILVNGKSSSCFIDAQGRIGGVGGSPTIWQWLKYFGHDNKKIRAAIKDRLGI